MAPEKAVVAGIGLGMLILAAVEPIVIIRDRLEVKAQWEECARQAELRERADAEEFKRLMGKE